MPTNQYQLTIKWLEQHGFYPLAGNEILDDPNDWEWRHDELGVVSLKLVIFLKNN